METLTQKRLKELFTYNPGTGYLIRKIGVRGKRSKAGDRAGCVQKSTGYRLIRIDGKNYREHRLIFLYMTGEFPAEQVDHINRVRDDIRRLYRAFDTTVLQQFEPNTEFTLLNDLMPLSRSVRIEQSRYDYARTGGRGWAHTSMSGQIGAALDARSYTFDGTMVPIHDSGFKFEWRDPIFNSPSALQSQADAQRGSVEDVQRRYVDYIYNGFRDKAGNFAVFDGLTWKGLKDDERVAQIDLGASGLNIDFTSGTATSQAIRAGAIALRDQMRRVNNQYAEQTWYVSGEIISNLERYFSDNFQSGTIMDEILKLTGIAAIKEDSQLSGNEIVIVPLGAGVIAPIVGQAIGTRRQIDAVIAKEMSL